MRKELAIRHGERKKYRAIFSRIGKKTNYKGYREDTILLNDVREVETNQLVADHLWFSYAKSFEKIFLIEGELIEFEARVKKYTKGHVNKRYRIDKRTTDYKLSHPTKVKKVGDISGL
jgi:hypothetical protein